MAASAGPITSFGSVCFIIAIIFLIGFDPTTGQNQQFKINVYDDYPQEEIPQYEDYRLARYQVQPPNRYQVQPPKRYQVQPQNQYQVQPPNRYQDNRYKERYEPRYEKPIEQKKKSKNEQDFSKIPGVPGIDYPIYNSVPHTSFSCAKVPYLPGMYANVEAGCQAYHTCHDGREGDQGASFLCTNGTVFNQKEFACDWWYNVDCSDSFKLYKLNGDATTNPFVPKAKKEEILQERLKIVVF